MQSGPFDSYLAMNLPFSPVKELYQKIQALDGVSLKSRGEAHITVVTPVEYWSILKPHNITIEQINQIADLMKIQNSKFDPLCVGRGSVILSGKEENTYFIVVQSNDLVNIRREIQALLVQMGGGATEFNPENFYPHITIGFTSRDLHESDGIIKNTRLCVHSLIQ